MLRLPIVFRLADYSDSSACLERVGHGWLKKSIAHGRPAALAGKGPDVPRQDVASPPAPALGYRNGWTRPPFAVPEDVFRSGRQLERRSRTPKKVPVGKVLGERKRLSEVSSSPAMS